MKNTLKYIAFFLILIDIIIYFLDNSITSARYLTVLALIIMFYNDFLRKEE